MIGQDASAPRGPWVGVKARHLATLSAVARTGSFRRAAGELGYVQSSVSQQLAALEQVVGTRLVERRRGRGVVSLTRAGELLAKRGEVVLGRLEAAQLDARAAMADASGPIRLAVLRDLAPHVLECMVSTITDRLPSAALDVTEAEGDGAPCRLVENGDADIAVDVRPHRPPLTSVILFEDPFDLVVGYASPLGRQGRPLTTIELAELPLLVPRGTVDVVQLATAGVSEDRVISVAVPGAIPMMVATGHGVGLVPRSQVRGIGKATVALPMSSLLPPRCIALCWHPARLRTSLRAAVRDVAGVAFPPVADRERSRTALTGRLYERV